MHDLDPRLPVYALCGHQPKRVHRHAVEAGGSRLRITICFSGHVAVTSVIGGAGEAEVLLYLEQLRLALEWTGNPQSPDQWKQRLPDAASGLHQLWTFCDSDGTLVGEVGRLVPPDQSPVLGFVHKQGGVLDNYTCVVEPLGVVLGRMAT